MITGTRRLTVLVALQAPSLQAYDRAVERVAEQIEALELAVADGATVTRLEVVRVERGEVKA